MPTPANQLVMDALRGYANHVANGGAYSVETWLDLANHAADILSDETSVDERVESMEFLRTFTEY